jgi:hypothetical protein
MISSIGTIASSSFSNELLLVLSSSTILELTDSGFSKPSSEYLLKQNRLILDFKQNNILETYISETYNYLIENQHDILPFYIKNEEFICLGTPEDIDIYNKRELG